MTHFKAHCAFARPVLGILAALVAMPSCSKHADGDGHGHKPAKAQASSADPAGHADEVTFTAEAIERHGITIQVARAHALRPTLVVPARVGFNTEAMAHVGAPMRGRAIEIGARLGDVVKRGDALLVIESSELGEAQAEYLRLRGLAESSAPGADLACMAWERAKGLYEQSQGISLAEVQKREAEHKTAAAALKTAELAVSSAANRLRLLGVSRERIERLGENGEIAPRSTICAPIDGQVVQREVTLGELVGPDRAEALIVLADTSMPWVLAEAPETRFGQIAQGARAWVTVGSTSSTKARRIEGIVTLIAPLVDSATRTVQVRIEIPAGHAGQALKPGMFAEVEIETLEMSEPVVAVPIEAVQTVEGRPAIFVPVPGEANTFARRAVRLGASVGDLVPVLSGLADGEMFVGCGTFILKAELGKGSAAHEH